MQALTVYTGSLLETSLQQGCALAETFIGCDTVVIVDVSGSMNAQDSRGGKKRFEVACEELQTLQNGLRGRIGVIAFSGTVEFVPGGSPPFLGGGTDLTQALRFAKVADVPGIRFIVISDGHPNDPDSVLNVARQYTNRIDTVFVGREEDARARGFLERLTQISGGRSVLASQAEQLATKIETLMLEG